ncbi:MAG: subtilisin-like proprotein convertase family protein [Neolewinella sp.]|jgi:subtilisin-like proprotein convertase family protein
MRLLYTLLLLIFLAPCVRAQTWTTFNTKNTAGDRRIVPKQANTVAVNAAELHDLLFSAPNEKTATAETSPFSLQLPTPSGEVSTFRIVAYDIAEEAALTKYPDIRTWYGVNTEDPSESIFLDWTARGFHASVRGGKGTGYFIDPVYRHDVDHYQVYTKADLDPAAAPFTCYTEANGLVTDEPITIASNKALGDCELMQYRTTMTATGEYSNFHGATSEAQSALVQSAIVTTVNRVNQIVTRNLSLRLQLVANNDLLYSYDPDNDPFPNNNVGDLLNANTPYVNDIIGVANYDYGHIVSQGGGGGVASLRASCQDGRKAAGATSLNSPEGDFFDVDYVAHEMGHNFGGNHTQNNDCNYSSSAGMEPGSGSTIMSYAGICGPNVQGQVDDYYHGRSIEEMTTHFEIGNGGCGTIINTSLNNATIISPADETIPAGTPFVLTSGATGNGTINYNWEQYDVERGAVMPPVGTNVQGPLFRTLPATASPERFFPKLNDVIAGTSGTWEATPTVNREMNFRATVLNYNAAYGCATEDNITLQVNDANGPFTVLDPLDGNHQWSAGQTAQVRWDVAATDQAPYNTQLMDVLLSTDGGASFQTMLADTPNDGYSEITVPNQIGNQNRVMVRSKDNVFYNVSTANFSIVSSAGLPMVTLSPTSTLDVSDCFASVPTEEFSFVTTSAGGANAPITWSVSNLPAGITESYSVNPSLPGGSFELTLGGLNNLPTGTTTLTLNGTSSEGTFTESINLENTGGVPSPGPSGLAPAAIESDLLPALSATPQNNVTYDIQVSNQPDFGNLLYSLSGLPSPDFSIPDYLVGNTTYFWRIRTVNDESECGISLWSEASFTTGDCRLFSSTGAAQPIASTGPPVVAEMNLMAPLAGTVLDLDVYQLDIDHTYISDLDIELIHPDGTTALFWDQACGSQNNISASFDDEASGEAPCPPTDGGFYTSASDQLSLFDNLPVTGTWTLRVTDNADVDGGSLNGFTLKICLEDGQTLPVDFLYFTAAPQKDYILLDWATGEEINNRGFTVERSGTDISGWTALGFVAAGNDYTFPDKTALPHTDYFYRLRQEDVDGRVSYSDIKTAQFGEQLGLVLFPNPTENRLSYRFPNQEDPLPYTLVDVNGRIVAKGLLQPQGGSLELAAYPSGIYFLRASGETRKVTKL